MSLKGGRRGVCAREGHRIFTIFFFFSFLLFLSLLLCVKIGCCRCMPAVGLQAGRHPKEAEGSLLCPAEAADKPTNRERGDFFFFLFFFFENNLS